jgi:hypothetical protein
MCQWQIAARCENEFGACVHEHSCCSVETAILSTSLQYPSVLQNREPKWENPMSPYKSRLFTGNHPKCLENTGFRGSVLIPRKMVNSVVYAISLKTQNPVVAIPCGFDPRFRHQKVGKPCLFEVRFFEFCPCRSGSEPLPHHQICRLQADFRGTFDGIPTPLVPLS